MSTTVIGGPTKAEYIIQQLNASNAKKVALLIVVGFIVYHGLLHIRYGTDSCKWLLSDGRFKGDREWQPYGCMMHKYSQMDTRRCFRYLAFWGNQNHFIFIGDERIRMLYQSFLRHLQVNDQDDNASSLSNDPKANLEFVDYKLRLQVNFIHANEISNRMVDEFMKWQRDEDPPSAIIASCTYSGFKNGNITKDIIKQYSYNLTRIVKPIDDLIEKKSKVLWKLQDGVDEDHLPDECKNVQNKDIDKFNQAVRDILGQSNVRIWGSSKLIAAGLTDETQDGWKLGPLALQHDIQILLNMYCNDYMNYNDGSCCSSAESYTILQIVTYAVFGVCVILASGMLLRRWILSICGHTFYMPINSNSTTPNILTDISPPIFALSTLAVIMAYFYLCDRTNFFM